MIEIGYILKKGFEVLLTGGLELQVEVLDLREKGCGFLFECMGVGL